MKIMSSPSLYILIFIIGLVLITSLGGKQNISNSENKKEGLQMERIEVYLYEDENDPNNLNKIYVGDI